MQSTSLESRIDTLERQNRAWRRGTLAAFALGVAGIAVAFRGTADVPDGHFRIVTASKFSLVDPRTGKTRAELSHQVVPGGWAGITLWDDAGKPRAEFKLWEDGSIRLNSQAADGSQPWNLSVTADGKPKVEIGGRDVATR